MSFFGGLFLFEVLCGQCGKLDLTAIVSILWIDLGLWSRKVLRPLDHFSKVYSSIEFF